MSIPGVNIVYTKDIIRITDHTKDIIHIIDCAYITDTVYTIEHTIKLVHITDHAINLKKGIREEAGDEL